LVVQEKWDDGKKVKSKFIAQKIEEAAGRSNSKFTRKKLNFENRSTSGLAPKKIRPAPRPWGALPT